MRSLRVLTVVGLSIGLTALAAPAAGACVLDSFGPAGATAASPDAPVRPGGPVGYSIHALGTDESPGASPWVITAGDVEVADGMAAPDSGHEWTGAGTFAMPPLGAWKGYVTVEITLTDSGMKWPFRVLYDGTPAPAQAQAPDSAPVSAPVAATQPTTAPAAKPVSAPPASTRTKRARPRAGSRPAPRVLPEPRPASPAARAPQASHVGTPAPQVRAALESAPAALPAAHVNQPVPRTSQPVSRARVQRATPLETSVVLRRAAADAPAAQPRPLPTATATAPDRTALVVALGALLLALLAGGAGLAAVAIRRRDPLDPEPPDRLAEMEAELQELLTEERLRAEAEAGAPRTPVAP